MTTFVSSTTTVIATYAHELARLPQQLSSQPLSRIAWDCSYGPFPIAPTRGSEVRPCPIRSRHPQAAQGAAAFRSFVVRNRHDLRPSVGQSLARSRTAVGS